MSFPRSSLFPCLRASAAWLLGAAALLGAPLPDGPELAAELRAQRPAGNLTNNATLRIRDGSGRRREVPLSIVTAVSGDDWIVTYVATPPGGTESLIVERRGDAPPRYRWVRTPSDASGDAAGRREAGPGEGFVPFAGTDFWWSDLGLEFLHWPDQRVVKEELSNGRPCIALDSLNPGTGGYARIRSWIDAEFHALLRAEAYDSQGLLIKEFSTGSFRQIEQPDGTALWVLKDLRIRDSRADSRTELVYDLAD